MMMDKTPGTDTVAELREKEKVEPIASFLKMKLLKLSPGYARVGMKLREEYRNFNGMTFGGIIAALADQAFAYSCNSASYPSIASQFNIHFIAGPESSDELVAEGKVVRSGRRVGLTEITVTNQDGRLIARATGTSIPISQP
jgi:acyl-CoA thioesterase